MTDDDLIAAFERLTKTMKSAGLEWALAQVQEEIRFGRRATKRVKATTDAPSAVSTSPSESRARRKTVSFAATRPLTPKERLAVLINAVDQVIVATYEMELAVRDRVQRVTRRAETIHLVHEGVDNEDITINEPTEVRERHVTRLRQLLSELRGLVS